MSPPALAPEAPVPNPIGDRRARRRATPEERAELVRHDPFPGMPSAIELT
jgi:hypothetical protein